MRAKNFIKPYSAACDNNRQPILEVLEVLFADCREVLEIGSGTGQHAVYFAQKLPYLVWQSSDLQENHAGIKMWLDEAKLANTPPPLLLDVNQAHWPELNVEAVFCANTIHIIDWDSVRAMITGAGRLLPDKGIFGAIRPVQLRQRLHKREQCEIRHLAETTGTRTAASGTLRTLTNWPIQQACTCNTTMPCRRIIG